MVGLTLAGRWYRTISRQAGTTWTCLGQLEHRQCSSDAERAGLRAIDCRRAPRGSDHDPSRDPPSAEPKVIARLLSSWSAARHGNVLASSRAMPPGCTRFNTKIGAPRGAARHRASGARARDRRSRHAITDHVRDPGTGVGGTHWTRRIGRGGLAELCGEAAVGGSTRRSRPPKRRRGRREGPGWRRRIAVNDATETRRCAQRSSAVGQRRGNDRCEAGRDRCRSRDVLAPFLWGCPHQIPQKPRAGDRRVGWGAGGGAVGGGRAGRRQKRKGTPGGGGRGRGGSGPECGAVGHGTRPAGRPKATRRLSPFCFYPVWFSFFTPHAAHELHGQRLGLADKRRA